LRMRGAGDDHRQQQNPGRKPPQAHLSRLLSS
jgi:hypothetical protein